jgi:hypothetical protein
VQQPGACIEAVKKPGRSLLSGTQEKLEDHNLFRIRKLFRHCTIMCSKISNKVNRMAEILNLERSDSGRIGNIILRPLVCCEPTNEAALKFIVRGSPCHGVARMRHQPERNMVGRGGGY